MADVVLSVLAHPDDAEFLCAGAVARLRQEKGWQAHIASMTPGDCGSVERSAAEIAAVRRAEGKAAAALIGASYHCLEERDLLIFYGDQSLERVTRLLRQVRPRIVSCRASRVNASPSERGSSMSSASRNSRNLTVNSARSRMSARTSTHGARSA